MMHRVKEVIDVEKKVLREYAALIAETGAGVREGQEVQIQAELDQPEFVTMLAEECYKRGARHVAVWWSHQPMRLVRLQYETAAELGRVAPWEETKLKTEVGTLPTRIYLLSEDPDGLKDADAEKMSAGLQLRQKILKPYRDEMDGKYPWCIAAVPSKAWAEKLFPGCADAEEKLWRAILQTARADGNGTANWKKHNADLKARCAYLNEKKLVRLHYTASNGTNLTVGLIPEARFCGGAETAPDGTVYNPNIPSEECFTSPDRRTAHGVVKNTKPLCYQGQIIDGFTLWFEQGKVVRYEAETNGALLGKLLKMDEGASYLGECALVPWESPINQTGLLFYNTLFDENACCHLALGRGFIDTIDGFRDRTLEEMYALGVNDSAIHEDFMIGTPDLCIEAETASGETLPIFKNGSWAF